MENINWYAASNKLLCGLRTDIFVARAAQQVKKDKCKFLKRGLYR
jgi:hypothetical protein